MVSDRMLGKIYRYELVDCHLRRAEYLRSWGSGLKLAATTTGTRRGSKCRWSSSGNRESRSRGVHARAVYLIGELHGSNHFHAIIELDKTEQVSSQGKIAVRRPRSLVSPPPVSQPSSSTHPRPTPSNAQPSSERHQASGPNGGSCS